MLRKMYLVPPDHYHNGPSPKRRSSRRKTQHPYDECIKMRHKCLETDIRRKTLTKAISDFLRGVMPDRAPPTSNNMLPSFPEPELSEKKLKFEAKTPKTRPLANSVDFSKNCIR